MTSSDRDARERAMWAGLAAWEATGEVMPDVVKARADRLRLQDYMDAVTRAARAQLDRGKVRDQWAPYKNDDGTVDLLAIDEALRDGRLEPDRINVAGLFIKGKVNSVFGSSTAGKSWVCLDTALRLHLETGEQTIYVDAEDSPTGFATRIRQYDERLFEAIRYFPALGGSAKPEALFKIIDGNPIALVIIDSMGEMLAGDGKNSNVEQEVTEWGARVARPIADAGPAVILIDHVAKTPGSEVTQVGSFRKQALLTGNQYYLQSKTPFSRNDAGQSVLITKKDRTGFFTKDKAAASYDFEPQHDALGSLTITAMIGNDVAIRNEDDAEITMRMRVMEEVTRWEAAEVPGPRGAALGASLAAIQKYLNKDLKVGEDGRVGAARVKRTCRWLVDHGHLSEQVQGQGFFHRVLRPYTPEFEADVDPTG